MIFLGSVSLLIACTNLNVLPSLWIFQQGNVIIIIDIYWSLLVSDLSYTVVEKQTFLE